MEEFDEAATPVFWGEELIHCIMVERVEDHAAFFPKMIAVEEDVCHGVREVAMWAKGVVPGSGTEGCRVIHVKCMVGRELKWGALKGAGVAREDSGDEWMGWWERVVMEDGVGPPGVWPMKGGTVTVPFEVNAVFGWGKRG
jgi:hypothetical protein